MVIGASLVMQLRQSWTPAPCKLAQLHKIDASHN